VLAEHLEDNELDVALRERRSEGPRAAEPLPTGAGAGHDTTPLVTTPTP